MAQMAQNVLFGPDLIIPVHQNPFSIYIVPKNHKLVPKKKKSNGTNDMSCVIWACFRRCRHPSNSSSCIA